MPDLADDAFRRERLLSVEAEILRVTGNMRERIVALDTAGSEVFAKTGTAVEIGFTREELAAMDGRTDLITHNHDDSSAFSLEDLTLAYYLDVREIDVFGPRVRWRLLRGLSGWPPPEALRTAFSRADRTVRRELLAARRAGRYGGNPFLWADRGGMVWDRIQREHPGWFILIREERP